jgi:cysteinyl-tRNA synthetase
MALRFYNSLGRSLQEFVPIREGRVGMYCCGPTVYLYPTIGNMAAYVSWDVLRRYLEYKGYDVTHVMNITDVGHLTSDSDTGEDKMEVSAQEQGKSPWEIAQYYTDAFFADTDALNILRPHHAPKATETVPQMIEFLKRIEERGFLYKIDSQNPEWDGMWLDTSKIPGYGRLSGNTLEGLQEGARVDPNPHKRNPTDFSVWRAASPAHIMKWDSPWGVGRPGWHLECSVMGIEYLGDHFDIHTGGEDHLFPHHECEIAQNFAAVGRPVVNYWLHRRFILVDGEKMSKSKGNFYRLSDVVERGFEPLAYRYLVLAAHYRSQMNFTWGALGAATNALNRFRNFVSRLDPTHSDQKHIGLLSEVRYRFETAMDADLNSPAALGHLHDLVTIVNTEGGGGREVLDLFLDIDRVLGLRLEEALADEHDLPEEFAALIREREEARACKDWARSDEIRAALAAQGIAIEDTPQGPVWRRMRE